MVQLCQHVCIRVDFLYNVLGLGLGLAHMQMFPLTHMIWWRLKGAPLRPPLLPTLWSKAYERYTYCSLRFFHTHSTQICDQYTKCHWSTGYICAKLVHLWKTRDHFRAIKSIDVVYVTIPLANYLVNLVKVHGSPQWPFVNTLIHHYHLLWISSH